MGNDPKNMRNTGEPGVDAVRSSSKTGDKAASALVDVVEAAAMCRMSRTMFYKLHSSGRTPRPVKLGTLTRWNRRELLDWIEAGCPPRAKWETMRKRR